VRSKETRLLWDFADRLRESLPSSWRVRYGAQALDRPARALAGSGRADAVLAVEAPDGSVGSFAVEVKEAPPTPKKIEGIASAWEQEALSLPAESNRVIVLSPYLSPGARAACLRYGMGYGDETGALRLRMASPAVFIERQGAAKNPKPREPSAASMRGQAAARIARALVSVALPAGGQNLASRAGVSPSQVSKVLALLVDEGLIQKESRGPVLWVDRRGLIERWAQDYKAAPRLGGTYLLSARGLEPVLDALKATTRNYAISGGVAANRAVRLAANPQLLIYAADTVQLAEELPAQPSERRSANVVLVAPPDERVLLESAAVNGLTYAPWSQVLVDLLVGTKREPAVGEKLLDWMGDNQDAWQSFA